MKGLGGGHQAVSPHIHRPFRPSKPIVSSQVTLVMFCRCGVWSTTRRGTRSSPSATTSLSTSTQYLSEIHYAFAIWSTSFKIPVLTGSNCNLSFVASDILWVQCLLIFRWYYQTWIGIWYDTVYLLCEQIYEVHIMYKNDLYVFTTTRVFWGQTLT